MPRVSGLRGGHWTNVEDEILKVAVMKYGKNQWARISSLLVRKSPKQCKARWCEWLDPSIKKTEWTREEDERLLQLVKQMPSQWRSIGPVVGRTATQCLERYEQLLDQAHREAVLKESGNADISIVTLDELKRIRPGEVDVQPEHRPARPDPIDMDEEEKEMLSEARARLANTQGKKAKRKARERILEEARRLSSLQKRRELREAGVLGKGFSNNKRKGGTPLSYNAEVPFQRFAPTGLHDVTEELAGEDLERATHEKWLTDQIDEHPGELIASIDGEVLHCSRDVAEAEARRRDLQKEREREERLGPAFLPAHLAKKLAEQQASRRAALLNLPKPQLSDADLELLAKLSEKQEALNEGGSSEFGLEGRTVLGSPLLASTASNINFGISAASPSSSLINAGKSIVAALRAAMPPPQHS